MAESRKHKPRGGKRKSAGTPQASSEYTTWAKPREITRLCPIAPALWQQAMKRLRRDFLAAGARHGHLRCPLIQRSTCESAFEAAQVESNLDCVRLGDAAHYAFRCSGTTDRDQVHLRHPMVCDDGTPIVDSEGRAMMRPTPVVRLWSYLGTPGAFEHFTALAKRGGRALLGSPQSAIAWIPPDTLITMEDENRWVWSLFALAWQGRHPSLRAERKTWFRRPHPNPNAEASIVYVPYDLQALRSLRELAPARALPLPEEWAERLPGYFISELPDLFQASVDLIDVVFDLVAQAEGEAQVPPKNGSATVSEPSPNVSKWNALTDRQRNCLRALRESKAHNADSRRRASDVAVKAEGFAANVNGFKEPLSNLVLQGLVNSKTGAGGGYWLTEAGGELLAEFDPDRSSGSQPS